MLTLESYDFDCRFDSKHSLFLKKMSSHSWKKFFNDAGLPPEIADNYAIVFIENRIRFDMLNELDKEILHDMGIKKIGDIISILRHAKEVHTDSYKAKVFKTEEIETTNPSTELSKKSIHQADSTMSSNSRSEKPLMNSSRIVKPPQNVSQRIVKLSGNETANAAEKKTQIIRQTNPSNVDHLVRQVTGLGKSTQMRAVRKRISPPSYDDDEDIATISNKMTKKNLTLNNARSVIDAQNRLRKFSSQINQAIASNNTLNRTISSSKTNPSNSSVSIQRKLPIQSRLNIDSNQSRTNSNNKNLSIKGIY